MDSGEIFLFGRTSAVLRCRSGVTEPGQNIPISNLFKEMTVEENSSWL
jgi:hypothetical protein